MNFTRDLYSEAFSVSRLGKWAEQADPKKSANSKKSRNKKSAVGHARDIVP